MNRKRINKKSKPNANERKEKIIKGSNEKGFNLKKKRENINHLKLV